MHRTGGLPASKGRWIVAVIALLLSAGAVFLLPTPPPAEADATDLKISEFRLRGPSGANDEFIEIYNSGNADHTVAATSGTGYGVAASDGTTRCSIPDGTVIPARGHYLCVNSVGYSLASYPAGNGTTATGDATYTTNIPDNAGLALFNNNTGGASYSLANRLDAVGSTSEANTVYKEGTGYPALVGFNIDYSFYRDFCTARANPTPSCTASNGTVKDTGDNAADFLFVDTNGTSAGAGQRLGAPGPENLSSPVQANGSLPVSLLDSCVGASSPPNLVRDFTSDPANNSLFGTLDVRRTITNNTGANVTRLRVRVIDLTTFPSPSGISDLRPRTSTAVVVTVDREPCGSGTSNVTVEGTTLEQPPSQPNGGGFNSSLSANTVTLATPLAPGASIDLRFLFGIQQMGDYRFLFNVEALPGGSTGEPNGQCGDTNAAEACAFEFVGDTDPTISDISNQTTNEDTSTGAIPFTIGDAETDEADLTVTATSSDTTLVPNANITLGGSGASRTVNVTPAPDQNGGPVTITVNVEDEDGNTASDTFDLTVNPVNDAPSFDAGPDQTVNENAGPQTVPNWATNMSEGPPDESGQNLAFLVSNGNNALFSAQPDIAPDGTLTYTPAPNTSGSAIVTVRLKDDGGTANGGEDTSAPQTFTITVNEVDDPPPPPPPPPPPSPPSNDCTITGTPGSDILRGTPRRDVICGLGGNDIIRGLGGNDVIRAGGGNDILYGEAGNDALFGGPGNDILRGGPGRDALEGGPGRDVLRQ